MAHNVNQPTNRFSDQLTRRSGLAVLGLVALLLTACSGGGGGSSGDSGGATGTTSYTVSATAGSGGSISPTSATVTSGSTTSFTVTPDSGYQIDTVSGCSGSLVGTTYTTGAITADCAVSAIFATLPTVSVANASVNEGNSGTANLVFTVSLSAGANGNVTVNYATSDGSATAGSDYTAASGTLTISSGTTSNTITVTVNGDTALEADETLTLTLSNVSANATLGTATATGTITNDDLGALNDTGITTCGKANTNGLSCPQTDFEGQDAEYGRDATVNDDSDGHAGFSFTKLDASGTPLANQSDDYTTTPWSCVQDNVTGLMWEVKTNDTGLHGKGHSYTWYNSDNTTNGGSAGTEAGGSCLGTVPGGCDTEKFIAAVNTAGLCGHADWRMPTRKELLTLVNNSIAWPGPAIDTAFIPNTEGTWYWSSSPSAADSSRAWWIQFDRGSAMSALKSAGYRVRLVRTTQ